MLYAWQRAVQQTHSKPAQSHAAADTREPHRNQSECMAHAGSNQKCMADIRKPLQQIQRNSLKQFPADMQQMHGKTKYAVRQPESAFLKAIFIFRPPGGIFFVFFPAVFIYVLFSLRMLPTYRPPRKRLQEYFPALPAADFQKGSSPRSGRIN